MESHVQGARYLYDSSQSFFGNNFLLVFFAKRKTLIHQIFFHCSVSFKRKTSAFLHFRLKYLGLYVYLLLIQLKFCNGLLRDVEWRTPEGHAWGWSNVDCVKEQTIFNRDQRSSIWTSIFSPGIPIFIIRGLKKILKD